MNLQITDNTTGREYQFPKDIDYRFPLLKECSIPCDFYISLERVFERSGDNNWFLVASSPIPLGYGEEDKRYFRLDPSRFQVSFEGMVEKSEVEKILAEELRFARKTYPRQERVTAVQHIASALNIPLQEQAKEEKR